MKRRPLLLIALVFATALAAVVPMTNAPMARLANYDADSREPITTEPVDTAALRRAAVVLPDDARYAIVVVDNTSGQITHDVEGVARLLFLPALPVLEPQRADWLLLYGGAAVPAGVSVVARTRFSDGVELVRVR